MRNSRLKEKVAYLQGLTKGLSVNEASAEGKLLVNIVDVLDSFAQEVKDVNMAQVELEEYVESIDADLANLEDEIYSDEEDDDDEWVEMSCPSCKELVSFEANILDEEDEVEVTCPYCRGLVYDNTIDLIEETSYNSSSTQNEKRGGAHPGI
jgi:phage FluMu protein Com